MSFDSAYREYLARKRGKPSGIVKLDGKWQISKSARQPCCDDLNQIHPGQHLKSAKHIAHEFGLDPDRFTEFVRLKEMKKTRAMRR